MNISCNFAHENKLNIHKTGSMPSSNSTLYQVSVCCLFFGYKDNELKLLVRKTDDGKLAFPQKFLPADSSLYDTACEIAEGILGKKDYYIKQIGANEPEHSDNGNNLTIMYYVLTHYENFQPQEQIPFYWQPLSEANLSGTQKMVVGIALKRIRRKISIRPIAFYLLPELFTLSQFQNLYELILNSPVDKRNFRKRICEMNYIQQTDLIDKTSSKRGAHLYAFNAEVYRKSRVIFKL